MALSKLQTQSLLTAALEGLEIQKVRLDEQIREVRSMMGHGTGRRGRRTASEAADKPARKKRTLSAAARKRIATAQKARWAKFRKANPEAES